MSNGMKILLIVMISIFCSNGGRGLVQNAMRGEKFQKVQSDPPTIKHKDDSILGS